MHLYIPTLLLLTLLPPTHSWLVHPNGHPGPMATAAAEACLRKGLTLAPFCLTGPAVTDLEAVVTDPDTGRSQTVRLIRADDEQGVKEALFETSSIPAGEKLIAFDYTHPTAVLGNAALYVESKIPFVMGSTGGDRSALSEIVAGHPCVIAPNMGKQIVAMQLALETLASRFPGSFDGYSLEVEESHQKQKADTSGTCLAVVETIGNLQGPKSPEFKPEDITLHRSDESSSAFGVPAEHLTSGHAHHTYRLTSSDKTVSFELQHDVNGRRVYADGTADAIDFLLRHLDSGGEERVYSMVDVLEGGGLE